MAKVFHTYITTTPESLPSSTPPLFANSCVGSTSPLKFTGKQTPAATLPTIATRIKPWSASDKVSAEAGGMKKRVYYTYDFKVGNTVVYQGITKDPKRREQEHKQRWQNGRLVIVGRRKTEENARKWQAAQLDMIAALSKPK